MSATAGLPTEYNPDNRQQSKPQHEGIPEQVRHKMVRQTIHINFMGLPDDFFGHSGIEHQHRNESAEGEKSADQHADPREMKAGSVATRSDRVNRSTG